MPDAAKAAATLDGQPIDRLYRAHHSWLQSWLYRRLGNRPDAADLTHDTFVRILGNPAIVSELAEPRAFLTTLALRVLSNFYRRQKIEQAYLNALAAQPEAVACSPEDRALVLETLVEIDRLLDGLPGPVRQAFLLSQLEGLKQAQIASRLGVSLPTAKRYIARAVQHCFFAAKQP